MHNYLKYSLIGCVVAVVLLWAVPALVPLNSYKSIAIEKVKQLTGRDLQINGDIKLAILPSPSVTVKDAKLSSITGSKAPYLLKLVEAKATLDLGSLIRGKIKISDIALEQPTINLEVLKDGAKNWSFPALGQSTDTSSSPTDKPLELPLDIENIKITQGKLTYTQNDDTKIFDDIDLSAKFHGTRGPINFEIKAKAFEKKIDIQGNVLELGNIIPMTIDANIFDQKIRLEGKVDTLNSSFAGMSTIKGNTRSFNVDKDFESDYTLDGQVTLNDKQLLVSNAKLDIREAQAMVSGKYDFGQNNAQASININPGGIQLELSASSAASIDLKLQAEAIKPLLEIFKISDISFPVVNQKLLLSAKISYANNEIGIQNINFSSGGSNVQGRIAVRNQQNSVLIPYDLSTNNVTSLLALFGVKNSNAIGTLRVSGSTQKSQNVFYIENKVSVLGSDIMLKGNINLANSKPKIVLNAQTNTFNLDNLHSGADVVERGKTNVNKPTAKVQHVWPNDIIDLSFLNSIEADITVQINRFLSKSLVMNSLKAAINVKDEKLNIASVAANIYGGQFTAHGYVQTKKDQAMSCSINLQNADLQNIVPQGQKIKVTAGKLNLQADLTSKGNSVYGYIHNLSGKVNLDADHGKISGFNLAKIVDTVNSIKNIQGIIGVLNLSFTGGETQFNTLVSKANIVNGVATLQECRLDATPALASATGQINLPQYVMDVNATVTIQNFPPFAVKLYGALDNPQHTLDTKLLQNYLMKNVLNSVITDIKDGKTKPENIIKDALGFGKSNPDATPAEEKSNQDNSDPVNKVLQQGLQKLFQ